MSGRNLDYPMPQEGKMAKSLLWAIEQDARNLRHQLRDDDNLPSWVNNYIAQSADRTQQVHRYLAYKLQRVSEASGHDLGCPCYGCSALGEAVSNSHRRSVGWVKAGVLGAVLWALLA